jgi:dihydroflavonol-4-reductase
MSTVLVTGGSGFLAAHIILQLLAAGHDVRTTVRKPDRAADVLAMLRQGGAVSTDGVSFFVADLEADAGWAQAIEGCDYVLHVASPLPPQVPRDENELIVPAREGTLRVLRAARDAGVKRVVVTSSFAAIGYGHAPQPKPFDETDWTNVDGADVQPYPKSKTLAERAAWDFIAREGGELELSVINPVAIFGPVLGTDYSSPIAMFRMLMDGSIPIAPKIYFGLVDVRDAADLHIRAMTSPLAKGERFIAAAGETMSLHEIAGVLRRRMGASAAKAPRFEAPNWLIRLLAIGVPRLADVLPQLGMIRRSTGAKAVEKLNWSPRPNEEIIVATAESLLTLGVVKAGLWQDLHGGSHGGRPSCHVPPRLKGLVGSATARNSCRLSPISISVSRSRAFSLAMFARTLNHRKIAEPRVVARMSLMRLSSARRGDQLSGVFIACER